MVILWVSYGYPMVRVALGQCNIRIRLRLARMQNNER